jgi:hypothetical protein
MAQSPWSNVNFPRSFANREVTSAEQILSYLAKVDLDRERGYLFMIICPRITTARTERHTFAYDEHLQELRSSMPGKPEEVQFFDLAECYQLRDLLSTALPTRTCTEEGGHSDAH